MKVVAIFGRPACGKSTAMRRHISLLGKGHLVKKGLLKYHVYPDSCSIVMGEYDEEQFSGTDRLSKAVAPHFRTWLMDMACDRENFGWVVYWEGERFSNKPCLDFMYSIFGTFSMRVFLLEVPEEELTTRYEARVQSPTWLLCMKTRMANLAAMYPLIRATNESIDSLLNSTRPPNLEL